MVAAELVLSAFVPSESPGGVLPHETGVGERVQACVQRSVVIGAQKPPIGDVGRTTLAVRNDVSGLQNERFLQPADSALC